MPRDTSPLPLSSDPNFLPRKAIVIFARPNVDYHPHTV
jgi:hypothetical protein